MTGARMTRRAAVLAAAGVVARRRWARAAPAAATVVGIGAMPVLSNDPRGCATNIPVAATVPLGQIVEVVDASLLEEQASGRFVAVRAGATAGFAQDWYLRMEGHSAPFLLQGAAGSNRLALIFNIGVGYKPDVGILDTLAGMQTPATMFPMGWWADQHPEILTRMVAEGYPIGTHGYESIELTQRGDDEVAADVLASATAIEHATGQPIARLFTPYAAAMDARVRSVVADTGFLPVSWTAPAADYGADATEEGVYNRVVDGVHDGALIELHLDAPASAVSTGRALPRLITDLRAAGYRFVTVPEMLASCAPEAAA